MKTRYIPLLLLVLSIFISPLLSNAQKNKIEVTRDKLTTSRAIFKAQTALPSSGGLINLTTDYDLRFSKDSIVAYLPYYGRAYSASYGQEGGIRFTSTSFDYKIKERKKGLGWEISFKPKDVRDIRELNMIVSTNGNATLQVSSLNRQPINFNGNVIILP